MDLKHHGGGFRLAGLPCRSRHCYDAMTARNFLIIINLAIQLFLDLTAFSHFAQHRHKCDSSNLAVLALSEFQSSQHIIATSQG